MKRPVSSTCLDTQAMHKRPASQRLGRGLAEAGLASSPTGPLKASAAEDPTSSKDSESGIGQASWTPRTPSPASAAERNAERASGEAQRSSSEEASTIRDPLSQATPTGEPMEEPATQKDKSGTVLSKQDVLSNHVIPDPTHPMQASQHPTAACRRHPIWGVQ